VERDEEKALHYFRMAAEGGDADAQYLLGILHLKGKAVNKSKKKAIALFTLASDQNHLRATKKLKQITEKKQQVRLSLSRKKKNKKIVVFEVGEWPSCYNCFVLFFYFLL